MRTIDYSANLAACSAGKVVDLEQFRRAREGCQEAPEWDGLVLAQGTEEEPARVHPLWERRAWILDVCASLGVLVMAAAFVLRALTL